MFQFLFCLVWLYNEKYLYLTCLKFFYLKSFLVCGDSCHNHLVDIFLVCFPSVFNLSVSLGNVNSILLGLRHTHLDFWIGKYHASNAWFQVFTCMNRLPTSYLLFFVLFFSFTNFPSFCLINRVFFSSTLEVIQPCTFILPGTKLKLYLQHLTIISIFFFSEQNKNFNMFLHCGLKPAPVVFVTWQSTWLPYANV